jgi:hypothetical protein
VGLAVAGMRHIHASMHPGGGGSRVGWVCTVACWPLTRLMRCALSVGCLRPMRRQGLGSEPADLKWTARPLRAFYLRRCHTPLPRKHTSHRDTVAARPTSRPTAIRVGPAGSVTVSDGARPGRTRAEPSRSARGLDGCAYGRVGRQIWIICLLSMCPPVRTGRLQARCAILVASGLRSDALIMPTNVTTGTVSPLH